MPVTPPEPAALTSALRAWLAESGANADVVDCGAMTGGLGFDNLLYRCRIVGSRPSDLPETIVLRVGRTADRHWQMSLEAQLHEHLRNHGIRTPAIHAVLPPTEHLDRPIQVMDHAEGVPVLRELITTPWRARRLVRQLAETLATVHQVPLPPWAASCDLWSVAGRRLATADIVAETRADAPEVLAVVHSILDDLRDAPDVLCHGDYHPANVLTSAQGLKVLDWTDAGTGDRHSDVARFTEVLTVAATAGPSAPARVAIRSIQQRMKENFITSYERAAAVTLDRERLRRWELVHLAHDWAAAEERGATTDGDAVAGPLWELLQRTSANAPQNADPAE